MALMMGVMMVVFMVVSGHHGFGRSHDASAPHAEAPHAQMQDAGKTEDGER